MFFAFGCVSFVLGVRTVGDGHLGQVLPPIWELLTRGLVHHERTTLVGGNAGGGADNDNDDDEGMCGLAAGRRVRWR